MRIIAGDFKKRRLQGPPDDSVTRPIPDLVKESLFNILRGHCEDGPVLDCFAGTGSIGLEALSRGAPHCTFVERDKRIAQILRANIDHCQAGDRAELVIADALGPGALSRCPRPLHLAFFDPPYPLVRDKAGLERVKSQMARVIAILDDTGYATLRTPWPLFHEPKAGDAATDQGDEGDEADERRPSRRSRLSAAPRRRGGPGGETPDHGPGQRSHRGEAGPGEDGPDEDMEEIEIDLSTPEGQALLEELMERGAIDPDDEGEEVDDADSTDAVESDPLRADSARPVVRIARRSPGERADLSIPGATGPETHVYAGMAVHLYMKARA